MAFSFGGVVRDFWHTMTSYDRHATHDSAQRMGRPLPANSGRNHTLSSVTTGGFDYSTQGLTSPYADHSGSRSTTALQNTVNGFSHSPVGGPMSPRPYSPGLRSNTALNRTGSTDNMVNGTENHTSPGEIQLQNFSEGLPPPPPVSHSWKRIDRWAEDNYQELYDQLCEGSTSNDLNELEHELDCSLPLDVRESLQIHDGQERGGMPSGIIFGCMLLDCEEITQEWNQWRQVNEELVQDPTRGNLSMPNKAFGAGSSAASSSAQAPPVQQSGNPHWRQQLAAKQDCMPPNSIQKVYAHPGWIPLARDWGGNNIAVDLAPGPTGRWGQIILCGRDYDCKYVIARSWASFMANVADDLASEKWFIVEDSGELKLKEFKSAHVEPGYLDILRWRMDQKYGRRAPKRKPQSPRMSPRVDTKSGSMSPPPGTLDRINGGLSPFGSPITSDPNPQRGRSMNRNSSPSSPRNFVSSPLSKAPEGSNANGKAKVYSPPSKPTLQTENLDSIKPVSAFKATPTLLEASTPTVSNPESNRQLGDVLETATSVDDMKPVSLDNDDDDEMKAVSLDDDDDVARKLKNNSIDKETSIEI